MTRRLFVPGLLPAAVVAAVAVSSVVVAGLWMAGLPTAHAAFPGLNGKIAVATEVYHGRCGDCGPSGGQAFILDRHGRTVSLPARQIEFSPTGARIAYEDWWNDGVWIARPDGSRRRLLAPSGYAPAWSPAGRLIAYQNYSRGVIVASADGRTKRPLGYHGEATWSPDGRGLALADGGSLRVVGLRGRYERIVALGDRVLGLSFVRHAWPASGWLSYRRDEELFIVPTKGGTPRSLVGGLLPASQLLSWGGDYADFAWSPDGTRVAFTRRGLWVMTVPDGTPKLIVPHAKMGYSATPQWSPDGRLIALVRPARHGYRIFTVPAAGGQVRPFGAFNDRSTDNEFVVDIDWQTRPGR